MQANQNPQNQQQRITRATSKTLYLPVDTTHNRSFPKSPLCPVFLELIVFYDNLYMQVV